MVFLLILARSMSKFFFNAERLEGEVHLALNGHRISKDREFFAISLNEAKETIEDLGQKYV